MKPDYEVEVRPAGIPRDKNGRRHANMNYLRPQVTGLPPRLRKKGTK